MRVGTYAKDAVEILLFSHLNIEISCVFSFYYGANTVVSLFMLRIQIVGHFMLFVSSHIAKIVDLASRFVLFSFDILVI